jgi:pectin lyase
MVGKGDQITMKGNYITRTAGRSPALSGTTLLHAVNNVWQDNNGHALEGDQTTARGIYEGNVFINVNSLASDFKGQLYAASAGNTNCNAALGRACQVNALENTKGAFPKLDTSFFSDFAGLSIASARTAAQAKAEVPANAGVGKV